MIRYPTLLEMMKAKQVQQVNEVLDADIKLHIKELGHSPGLCRNRIRFIDSIWGKLLAESETEGDPAYFIKRYSQYFDKSE